MKLTGNALKFFQKVGRKGGKNRAKKHSRKTLTHWASLGGRPGRPFVEQAALLRQEFETVQMARKVRNEKAQMNFALTQANRQAKFVKRLAKYRDRHIAAEAARKESHKKINGRAAQRRFKALAVKRESKFERKQALRERRFRIARLAQYTRFNASLAAFKASQLARQKNFEAEYMLLLQKANRAA